MDLDRLAAALAAFSVLEPTALPLHHVQVFLISLSSRGRALRRQIKNL
jgi:hypothetical protein